MGKGDVQEKVKTYRGPGCIQPTSSAPPASPCVCHLQLRGVLGPVWGLPVTGGHHLHGRLGTHPAEGTRPTVPLMMPKARAPCLATL